MSHVIDDAYSFGRVWMKSYALEIVSFFNYNYHNTVENEWT